MLLGIPHDQVNFYWGQCAPFIERALDESPKDFTLTDIYLAVCERNMQLWVWIEDERILAVLVTEVVKYPQKTVCLMLLGAGSKIVSWIDDETIYEWARDQGCDEMEIYGRKGWGRALGWKAIATHFRREL